MSAMVRNTSPEQEECRKKWRDEKAATIDRLVLCGATKTQAHEKWDEYINDSCCNECGMNYGCNCWIREAK